MLDRAQMPTDRSAITASHRAGQRRLTARQSVLQGGTRQRTDDPFGQSAGTVADQLLAQKFVALQPSAARPRRRLPE